MDKKEIKHYARIYTPDLSRGIYYSRMPGGGGEGNN